MSLLTKLKDAVVKMSNENLHREIFFLDKFKENEDKYYEVVNVFDRGLLRAPDYDTGNGTYHTWNTDLGYTTTVRLNYEPLQQTGTNIQQLQQLQNQAVAQQQYTQQQWNQGIYGGQVGANINLQQNVNPYNPNIWNEPNTGMALRADQAAHLVEQGMLDVETARRLIR